MSAPERPWTPGPWRSGVDFMPSGKKRHYILSGPDGDGLRTQLVKGIRGCGGTGGSSDANARLIASAPMLYEALEQWRGVVELLGPQLEGIETDVATDLALSAAIEASRAALIAARGEESDG